MASPSHPARGWRPYRYFMSWHTATIFRTGSYGRCWQDRKVEYRLADQPPFPARHLPYTRVTGLAASAHVIGDLPSAIDRLPVSVLCCRWPWLEGAGGREDLAGEIGLWRTDTPLLTGISQQTTEAARSLWGTDYRSKPASRHRPADGNKPAGIRPGSGR